MTTCIHGWNWRDFGPCPACENENAKHQAVPVSAEELDALRLDAARYRWLRDKRISGNDIPHLATTVMGQRIFQDPRAGQQIDAAMVRS